MDLMCVIDQSGSMAGALINLVKASLTGLLDKLGDRDRVSFVGFNNTAERVSPLIRCTAEGKARLLPIIQAFRCSGGTSIARGFLMGLEVLKRRQCCNDAVSLFLFSDGQNNSDGDPTDPCISALMQCGLKKFSVSTFGYSRELDSKLLEALSSIGKGSFISLSRIRFHRFSL
jgi:Mg-chelatase subunit ChlD